MSWVDIALLSFPPIWFLCLGEYAVLKLVGRRCASWFGIGFAFGVVGFGIGLILGIHFM